MSHLHHGGRGTPVAALSFDAAERAALRIARHFFHAFGDPDRQGWLAAFGHALRTAGPEEGPHLALATLNAIQSVRRVRHSAFRFNCPTCRECARYVSGNERTFMAALRAAARQDRRALAAHLWLLCEANDPGGAEAAFLTLAAHLRQDARAAAG